MANNTQMLISMKFVGINQVSPEMKKMADEAKKLKQQVNSLGSGPSGGFKWVDSLNKGLKTASEYLDNMKKKIDEMKSSGFANILTGTAAVAPIMSAVKAAGEMQTKMITIGGATGANKQELSDIRKAINDATQVTRYDPNQVASLTSLLATSGMNPAQVSQLTPIMSKFAEVQQFGKGASPEEAVTQAISSAHMLGIYDPKQLDAYLDKLNKATFMTPGSSSEFFDTFKYLAGKAKGMGMSNEDILYTSALANRVGFLGSMGGTESADMILRSIPGLFGGQAHVDKNGKIKMGQQLKAMVDLGLAKPDGSSVFFNNKGEFQGIQNLITNLAEASKRVNPEQLTKDFKNMFGMQGMSLANILSARGGEQLQAIQKQMVAMLSMTDMQEQYLNGSEGQLAKFENNLKQFNIAIGEDILPTFTEWVKTAGPFLSETTKWVTTHQNEVKVIAEMTAGFGALTIALGGAKIVLGTIASFSFKSFKSGIDGVLLSMESFKKQSALSKALPEQAIRANIVNVYGAEINGGGGSGTGVSVTEEGLPPRSSRTGTTTSWGSRALSASGSMLKGVLKRGGAVLPISLAFGAYDVMTAPEGHKVETAAKTSGTVIGGWAGAEAGAAMGAAIGSVVPGIGTAIGGLLGGIIGSVAGGIIGDKVGSAAYNAAQKAINNVPADDIVDSRVSRYAQRQAAANASNNNVTTYNDHSTHNYGITSTDPQGTAQEIHRVWNIQKQDFVMTNSQ